MSGHAILIAGGYGVVGSRIAADLAPQYPDRVVIAGRNPRQATTTAAALGHGARGRALDVTVPSTIPGALEDVAVVVNCIDQPRRGLLHAAIQQGLAYTDIPPWWSWDGAPPTTTWTRQHEPPARGSCLAPGWCPSSPT